jgi:hypothetical protein
MDAAGGVVVKAWLHLATILFACTACSERPQLTLGEECVINSDCSAPLGCRLGQCRRLCTTSRDCGAGYRCVAVAGEESGICQLPEDTRCALTSDCPPPLVCAGGTCTSECVEDRDCIAGAMCSDSACVEVSDESCIYTSDCDPPFVCAFDQTCQYECLGDVDCTSPRICCLPPVVPCRPEDINLCILPP